MKITSIHLFVTRLPCIGVVQSSPDSGRQPEYRTYGECNCYIVTYLHERNSLTCPAIYLSLKFRAWMSPWHGLHIAYSRDLSVGKLVITSNQRWANRGSLNSSDSIFQIPKSKTEKPLWKTNKKWSFFLSSFCYLLC